MRKFIAMYNRKLNLYVNIGETLNYNYYMHDNENVLDYEELPNDIEMATTIVVLKNNIQLKQLEGIDDEDIDILNNLIKTDNSYNVKLIDEIKQLDLLQQYEHIDEQSLIGHLELNGYLELINPKTKQPFKYGEKHYTDENFVKALLFEVTDLSDQELLRLVNVINYIAQQTLAGFQYKFSGVDRALRQKITNSIMLTKVGFETVILTLDENTKIKI